MSPWPKVCPLVDRQRDTDAYTVKGDRKDDDGQHLNRDIVFPALKAGSHTPTRNVILLRSSFMEPCVQRKIATRYVIRRFPAGCLPVTSIKFLVGSQTVTLRSRTTVGDWEKPDPPSNRALDEAFREHRAMSGCSAGIGFASLSDGMKSERKQEIDQSG